jgi:SAM-dependent methyltransferase
MDERYTAAMARHYAAFRPDLHEQLLERVLPADRSFAAGLDVGCGTGYSARALAHRCASARAIDPSAAMLERAAAHGRVTYVQATAERVPLSDDSVDVVTFAGSVSYVERAAAAAEARRVCRSEGYVVCYDFEVRLGALLDRWDAPPAAADPAYDHAGNFSGVAGFGVADARSEGIALTLTPGEAAHVLLSDAHRFAFFAQTFGVEPFGGVRRALGAVKSDFVLPVDLYWTAHWV